MCSKNHSYIVGTVVDTELKVSSIHIVIIHFGFVFIVSIHTSVKRYRFSLYELIFWKKIVFGNVLIVTESNVEKMFNNPLFSSY